MSEHIKNLPLTGQLGSFCHQWSKYYYMTIGSKYDLSTINNLSIADRVMDLSIKFCAFEWAVGGFGGKVCDGPFFIRIKDHEISRSACLDTACPEVCREKPDCRSFFPEALSE